MWWRLAVLSGLFFGVSRIWMNEAPVFRGTSIVYHNPVNGHYYQWVNAWGIDWHDAFEDAASTRFAGAHGHLATVGTEQESQFLKNHLQIGDALWIAASDEEQEGTWKWVAGEEAGKTFFVVGEEPSKEQFANWGNGEPNNQGDDEDFATIGWMGEPKWNDLRGNAGSARGYLVEFTGLPRPEKLIVTTGNTYSPQFGSERPTIVGEKDGRTWQW